MNRIHVVRFAVCILAMVLAGCSSDDLLDELSVEKPSQTSAPFQWTRGEDVETRAKFLRNFGVGYSYDAVRGEYCNWEDIRCQVVDRTVLNQAQGGPTGMIFYAEHSMQSSINESFYMSQRDYVAAVDYETKKSVNLGIYSKTVLTKQHALETGFKEVYYYSLKEYNRLATQRLAVGELLAHISMRGDTALLTSSFRQAVDHMKGGDWDNVAQVDSFIKVWGTHVIVTTDLGGTLTVDLANSVHRFNDKFKNQEWTTEEFLGAVKNKEETKTKEEFKWVEDGKLLITAIGGNHSSLSSLLGEYHYDGHRDFSIEGIDLWRKSLKYVPDDERQSNVEMIEMEVVPISDFIAPLDFDVAMRVEAAITQDMTLQMNMLGERNFFSATFPLRYDTASCQYHDGGWKDFARTDSIGDPMIVNIMSGGRYVATVCHEQIDDRWMWVCYPIYEGYVKQGCGMGVADDNTVYKVSWMKGKVTVTELPDVTAQDNFYITGGAVGVEPIDGVSYASSTALPAIELAGGVQPDGTYVSSAYSVAKHNDTFLLYAGSTTLTNIVGYSHKGNGIYKRNDNYVYIYNQNEIKKSEK